MNSDPEKLDKLQQLLLPHLTYAVGQLRDSNSRLVHYTSAENGLNIINSGTIWMRNASVMNDFMEIQHGQNCLAQAWSSPDGLKFCKKISDIYPGVVEEIENTYNGLREGMRFDTYLLSVSLHRDSEDELGRLSMWRAYGGKAGVALVLNNTAFLSESDALKAYSAPVMYKDAPQFTKWFSEWANHVIAEEEFLVSCGRNLVVQSLLIAFRVFSLCTKHPGFQEEMEWRVFHTPKIDPGSPLERQYVSLGGIPQAVMKIPLADRPEEGLAGMTIPSLLNRVIIGPTEYPAPIYDAYYDALVRAGVPNATGRLTLSNIPLRQN